MTSTYTTVALGKLKGADYNPRTMPVEEMQRLVNSIREFGFVQPVIARAEDMTLVGGHQRCAALRKLLEMEGETSRDQAKVEAWPVPTILVAGLTDEKTKLLNLALNKISGDWDYDRLGLMLSDLRSVNVDTLELSGFAVTEIDDILALTHVEPESIQAEEPAPVSEDPLEALSLTIVFPSKEAAKATRLMLRDKHGVNADADAWKAFVGKTAGALNVAGVKKEKKAKAVEA